MKTARPKPETIDDYISGFSSEVREKLQLIRKAIHGAAPDVHESIKYDMPTFELHGNLVYFAAWKKHIGFYNLPANDKTIKDELAPFAGPKGSLKFPLNQPVPLELIAKIVRLRVQENDARAKVHK